MNMKDIIKEGIKYSKYEKIDNGIYDFIVESISLEKTPKTQKDCIVYLGKVRNRYGELQEVRVVDSLDKVDNTKFAIARLIKFIRYFKVANEAQINEVDQLDQFIEFAQKTIGKSIKINFIQKMVSGYIVREKVFLYE